MYNSTKIKGYKYIHKNKEILFILDFLVRDESIE